MVWCKGGVVENEEGEEIISEMVGIMVASGMGSNSIRIKEIREEERLTELKDKKGNLVKC